MLIEFAVGVRKIRVTLLTCSALGIGRGNAIISSKHLVVFGGMTFHARHIHTVNPHVHIHITSGSQQCHLQIAVFHVVTPALLKWQ